MEKAQTNFHTLTEMKDFLFEVKQKYLDQIVDYTTQLEAQSDKIKELTDIATRMELEKNIVETVNQAQHTVEQSKKRKKSEKEYY